MPASSSSALRCSVALDQRFVWEECFAMQRGPQLKRQVVALNKLVGATVSAMSAAGTQS